MLQLSTSAVADLAAASVYAVPMSFVLLVARDLLASHARRTRLEREHEAWGWEWLDDLELMIASELEYEQLDDEHVDAVPTAASYAA